MKSINKMILLVAVAVCAFGCHTKIKTEEKSVPVVDSRDFTEPVFTKGIEGPAVAKDGMLYVVNYSQEGTIGAVRPDGIVTLFIKLPAGSIGNGLRFDQAGNLYVADYTRHNVLSIDMKHRKAHVYAHEETMNQPNDIAIMDNGILFASDPNWGDSTGRIWRIDLDSAVTLLEDHMGTTNGIEVSPDNKRLYVNESRQRKVWVYDLTGDGDISNKRLFHEFNDFGMDGMRCDVKGNLYITRHGKGTVAMLSPEGKLIREYVLKGKKPSNIAFGGKEGRTCYITLQDRRLVEIFEADYPGRAWEMWKKE
jgi:sugar lactone lactonase YvrE